ncbi:MAG: hypothetical protein M1269_02915 [Chloroflexi bacterium]|nr:hypothetical protein [Chloroflexota bacterium]
MDEFSKGYLDINFQVPKTDSVLSLLKAGWKTYRDNFGIILKITAVVFLPVELIVNYLIYAAGVQENFWLTMRIQNFVYFIFSVLVIPAIIYAIVKSFQGEKITSIIKPLSWGFSKCLRIIIFSFITSIAILVGAILLIIPGIYLFIKFQFIDFVISIEGNKVKDVLERSYKLTTGRWWTLFFSFILAAIIILLASFIAGIPLAIFDNWFMSAVTGTVIDVIIQFPVVTFLMAYLYSVSLEKKDEKEDENPPVQDTLSLPNIST